MMVRRLLALLTSVAMLHLWLVAGDVACALHGAGGHHAALRDAGAAAEHEMPMTAHAVDTSGGAEVSTAKSAAPPCDTPVQPRCCEAVASCGVAGTIVSRTRFAEPRPSASPEVLALDDDAPASYQPPPEPPPPKA